MTSPRHHSLIENIGLHFVSFFLLAILACQLVGDEPDQVNGIRLEDVLAKTGIDFVHTDGGTGEHYLFETVSCGLATFDYDGDGWLDIYFLSGEFPNLTSSKKVSRLYRNLGDWRFQDVTERAGVADRAYSLGVVAADYDNDGDVDLFVNNFGPNLFYVNNGDGTFSKWDKGPSSDVSRLGAGASFFDLEGDGDLDLWVGNYVKFHYEAKAKRLVFGVPAAPGPKDYEPELDQLFLNNGDGSFTDVSEKAGITVKAGSSMGMVAFDFDQDGDTDVFVANDSMENFLWKNDGKGHFEEVAQLMGVAYDFGGLSQASMGVDCADVNGDGWLDLVCTNFDSEITNVYINVRGEYFDDLGAAYGLGIASREVKWGVALADFDRDSFVDLFIATGHLFDGVVDGSSRKFAMKNRLFRSKQGKKWEDITTKSGGGMMPETVSRGVAADDMDGDGDIDLILENLNAPPMILDNQTQNKNHWIQMSLVGTKANRQGVGSTVIVRTPKATYRQEVHSGRGYQSHYGSRLSFGLDQMGTIDEIEIRWRSGEIQRILAPAVDSHLRIVQE